MRTGKASGDGEAIKGAVQVLVTANSEDGVESRKAQAPAIRCGVAKEEYRVVSDTKPRYGVSPVE